MGVGGKTTRDYIMLYNNIGLTSTASEEIASETLENCRFRQPHCGLQEPHIRTNLILPGTRVVGLQLPLIV